MYTIGEFSRICSVTTKALRHYEEIGLLKAARVDPDNQYRYYSAEQVALVRLIKTARSTGMPLQMIRAMLSRVAEGRPVSGLLESHRQTLTFELRETNAKLARLEWWKNRQEAGVMNGKRQYVVNLHDKPAVQVRSRRTVMTDFPRGMAELYGSVLSEIVGAGKAPAGPPIVLYYDREFNPEKVDIEVAWPVDDPKLANATLPAVTAAVTMHVGPYEDLSQAYAAVYEWVNRNGYEPQHPMRDVYYNDPSSVPPEQLATEVILPVRKKQG